MAGALVARRCSMGGMAHGRRVYRFTVDAWPNGLRWAAMSGSSPPPPAVDGGRILRAVLSADLGALAIVIGGVLSVTAGLLAIAATSGVAVGMSLRVRSGTPRQVRVVAAGLAVGGVGLGWILLWFASNLGGGVLGPIDYLAQTYGMLVPASLFLGGAGAWLAAR